jgi:hypothetical protein
MGEIVYDLNAGGAEVDWSGEEDVRNEADVVDRPAMAACMKKGAGDEEEGSEEGVSMSIGIV